MTDRDLTSHYSTEADTPGLAERNDYDWGLSVMSPYGTVGQRRRGAAIIGFGLAVVGLCATLTGPLSLEGLAGQPPDLAAPLGVGASMATAGR